MIGLWEQHRYGEKVKGHVLRYPKFLAYCDLAASWRFSDSDMAEVRRIESKLDLGGTMTDDERSFMDRMTARADPHDMYALAFPDGTDAQDVRMMLADDDGTIREALERMCGPPPEHVPARDHVLAAVIAGHTVVPLAEQTVHQGIALKQLYDEAVKARMEALASQQ